MMMKTCKRCRESKPSAAFYKTQPYECKDCTRRRSAKWRAEHMTVAHKQAWNLAVREKRQRVRDAVFAAYGGYRCSCCAETEPKFLTIDHVKNDGAEFRRQILGNRTSAGYLTYRWLVAQGFPAGYQVLCMNCNHGKRMNDGICPHQMVRNDQAKAVGSSDPKRTVSVLRLASG